MATVGQILDEFFSPFSSEQLWVMPETDAYTVIVRKWQPVIDASNRTKGNLAANCAQWQANYKTDPAWKPTMSDAPKPNAYREFVAHPPGTDPDTCEKGFAIYVASKAAKTIPGVPPVLPEIQTQSLHTCAIGSFNIYTTVDQIDCAAKTATMSFWMYNSMSKRSFGRFAKNPVFALSGMATQYMWWNWTETVDWNGGTVRTVPSTASTGTW